MIRFCRKLALLPWRTLLVALGSGAVLALAYPRLDLAAVAWIALVPLLLVADQRPFLTGFVAGVGFFGVVLYWLNIVMVTFGHLHPLLSAICYLLLVAYLALYFGAATWGACYLRERRGLSLIVTFPLLWIALEYLRSLALSGFPWALLGYSQQSWLIAIQSADLFGVYGISYLVALVNTVLAACLIAMRHNRPLPIISLIATALLFVGNLGYGSWRLKSDPDRRDQKLTVTLVQGNVDQSIKWDPAMEKETVQRYRDLSLSAAKEYKSRLIVWPESATPFYYQDRTPLTEEVAAVAPSTGAYLIFGSPAYEKRDDGRWHFLNSAFLLSPGGKVLGRSDKVHLVPFGEYVPLKALLPFVSKLVEGIGDFSPGTVKPLSLDGSKLGILVCYEGIFPELARGYVNRGSDLLVNVTNDAWYGRSSAPYQHLSMARFRAIENRVWLVRAANTGISAFIAPSGRIGGATPIFETVSTTGQIGLGSRPTLYRVIGDTLPALCLLFSCGLIIWTWRQNRAPSHI